MSGIPYHAWTHRPKADGGTDPIEVEPATVTVGGAAMLRATRTAFTQSGSYQIPWSDVDTDDTSVFGLSTVTLTNDTVVLKKQGLYLAMASAFPTATSIDYSVQIQLGGSMLPAAQDFPGIMAGVETTGVMGDQSFALRLMHCSSTGGSTTGVRVVRAGTKAFSYAVLYIIYWPSSVPASTFTDIG